MGQLIIGNSMVATFAGSRASSSGASDRVRHGYPARGCNKSPLIVIRSECV